MNFFFIKYYKISADKVNANAMNRYARLLYTGEGVKENKKEAARYFKMSDERGNKNAMRNYSDLLNNSDEIEANKLGTYKLA